MSCSSGSDSDDSDSSGGEDEAKMRVLLADWESKDHSENNDVFVDSDDSDNEMLAEVNSKKMALLKADCASEEESEEEVEEEVEEEAGEEEESDGEDEEREEESDEEEEEDDSEEEYEEEEEEEVKAGECEEEELENAKKPVAMAASNAADEDEGDVVDDGNIEDTLKKKPKKRKQKTKLAPISAATPDDTNEDLAMKALLQEWGGEDDGDDAGLDDSDDDEDSEASERQVLLEDSVIDHIVLAAPDLEEAMEQFEKMTGIGAVVAGSISGLGIKCARISFNDSSYIEIIAPDPKSSGPIGQLLKSKSIVELTPFHFAIRSSRAEELKHEVKKFGYVPDHITMFGGKKDGTPRKWEMLYLYGHKIGGICPYFINWANSDHPCATLPVVGKLKKFTIRAPADDPVHKLLAHVNIKGFNVEEGKAKLSFQFSSPEGTVKFATSKAVGFKFPGFDEDEQDIDVFASDDDDLVFDNPNSPELLDIADQDYEALPPPSY